MISPAADMKVMCYVVIFGLQHFETAAIEKLVKAFDASKAKRLYSYFLDPQNFDGWIKDQWKLLYEEEFVRRNFCEPAMSVGSRVLGRAAAPTA